MADMVASVPEADFLDGGKCFDDEFGEVGLGGRGRAEAGAVAGGVEDGVEHSGVGVAENERAPGPDIVDVFVVVGVPDARTQPADEKRRLAFDRFESANGGIHSAGD
jgi:hypothetical protein